jgi:hypothetical protein
VADYRLMTQDSSAFRIFELGDLYARGPKMVLREFVVPTHECVHDLITVRPARHGLDEKPRVIAAALRFRVRATTATASNAPA